MAKIKAKDVLLNTEKMLGKKLSVRKMKDGSLVVAKRGLPQKKRSKTSKFLALNTKGKAI